jgi:hypothetical protein
MDDANRWIAPVLGLPELLFVSFADTIILSQQNEVKCHMRHVI